MGNMIIMPFLVLRKAVGQTAKHCANVSYYIPLLFKERCFRNLFESTFINSSILNAQKKKRLFFFDLKQSKLFPEKAYKNSTTLNIGELF